MHRFIVIPREAPEVFADLSPEEMQRLIERYVAWSQELAAQGRLEMGEKLRDGAGRVLRGDGRGGASVTDGPFVETKEVVGGFWIIQAHDLDDAVRAVSGSPHLEYGSLEVRQIEEMG